MTTNDYAAAVFGYFIMAFVVWMFAAMVAETLPKGSFWRTTLAAVAVCWFIWPLAIPMAVIWVLGFGAFAMTVDAWKVLRGEDKP